MILDVFLMFKMLLCLFSIFINSSLSITETTGTTQVYQQAIFVMHSLLTASFMNTYVINMVASEG